MQRILLVTESPNEQATNLKHNELFDIRKNAISQFFGEALFGRESDYRQYFNADLFFWMHAKGSSCHGDTENDGIKAIRERINSKDYHYIATFGVPASKIFLSNSEAKLDYISKIMSKGPVDLKTLQGTHVNFFSDRCDNTPVAMLPHISGRAQKYWMKYTEIFSPCLDSIQQEIIKIVKN